jgi:hypothetical protein
LNFCLSIHFCNTFVACLIFYIWSKYPHCAKITFIQIVNFHIRFIVFVFLVSDVVAPPLIVIKSVHWARDGPNFVCKVDECNASYTSKYNLVWHLRACHNVTLKSAKSERSSCHNPSLGLVTKARVGKGVIQKWSPWVTFHALGSVWKCERMNPKTPKWAPTLGIRVSMDSWIFKEQL